MVLILKDILIRIFISGGNKELLNKAMKVVDFSNFS